MDSQLNTQLNTVSTHSRPKAAGPFDILERLAGIVSTHSRPKAAGYRRLAVTGWIFCFNSQPPEGGWTRKPAQPQPKRRFNSQPPEGGWFQLHCKLFQPRGFNSQPPEGGWKLLSILNTMFDCFNSQPPEGGWYWAMLWRGAMTMFQLTAARRRLVPPLKPLTGKACIALFR